jgi:hypothetical protein
MDLGLMIQERRIVVEGEAMNFISFGIRINVLG